MKRNRKKFFVKFKNDTNFHLKQRIFAIFVVINILLIVYIKYLATPVVVLNTKAQISNYATKSINLAIAETMNQNVSYGDLVKISKDDFGDISYIETNSVKINVLSKIMSKVVMHNFLEMAKSPIKISLGAFSGISIFAGIGPKIAYTVNPYGEVFCYFTSNFESAGINQTYHKLYLIISIKVNVVFPTKQVLVNSSSEVLLCENLIVGKIPEVYLNSNNLTDMLNLVPEKFSSWQIIIIVS